MLSLIFSSSSATVCYPVYFISSIHRLLFSLVDMYVYTILSPVFALVMLLYDYSGLRCATQAMRWDISIGCLSAIYE